MTTPDLERKLDSDGFAIVDDVVPEEVLQPLREGIEQLEDREEVRRKGNIYGVRNLLEVLPQTRELATSTYVRCVVEPVLGSDAFAIRATLFAKVPGANWKLGWHQDSTITVRQQKDVEGFGPWSQKAGIWHVEPPSEVMAQMLAVRVHLDPCGAENGPLRVLPGSHKFGWIDDLTQWKRDVAPVVCEVGSGGVVLMKPLLLHASSAAKTPGHRRVIHIEFAATQLPHGLQWQDQLRLGP